MDGSSHEVYVVDDIIHDPSMQMDELIAKQKGGLTLVTSLMTVVVLSNRRSHT